jgi:hypothetical protein
MEKKKTNDVRFLRHVSFSPKELKLIFKIIPFLAIFHLTKSSTTFYKRIYKAERDKSKERVSL